ncbi:MAG: GntR family transcriptional regulator [Pseudonocardia sp.]|uniref:GntR family transcriptional regulator n=1 Tax=unclassified Pseudonocardia TaxID=2619320 RepID=UPI00086BF516|nr:MULTISPECIES: GntR family transcriptional regulator [unclassified Pseudonocardia]MBN9111463.1 GntR family transcriptional regulator [Pseudonocardia sp.]ODV05871.1 MAG: GntR family transcriptional regulator [Pseudonocardia sp. SCN 73-27]
MAASFETASDEPSTATVDGVVTAVRDGIMQGRYAPGQRLPEADLVSLYQASRGAVRTALAQLESEGIVLRERNRGARVRPISLDEAVEITEARAVVEGLCAAKAAQRITADERTSLRALSDELRTAVEGGDVMAYTRANQEVHRAIRDISRHETAGIMLDRLRTQSVRYHYTVALLPGRPAVGMAEHIEVIESVCSGDADLAEQTMRAHLMSVVDALHQLDKNLHQW